MSWGFGAARLIVLAVGLTMAAAGLAVLAFGGAAATITALWLIGIGIAFMIGTLIERVRYRSAEAERLAAAPGPGGGEPTGTSLDPRFRPTEERFEDPTTGVRMRVWLDPVAGERRYVAEE